MTTPKHRTHNNPTHSGLQKRATTRLRNWRDAGLGRNTVDFSTGQHPLATINGDQRLLFSSSNYLGLSHHPTVIAAAIDAARTFGTGSGGSRLTTGSTTLHRQLEEELADWLGYSDCVVFTSGYTANLTALTVLADNAVTIFSDERNHASIIDGCRAARTNGATLEIYPHQDIAELRQLLTQRTTPEGLIVTDGVFSMEGTIAPVSELIDLAQEYECSLMIDDAHGLGTLHDGRGCAVTGTTAPEILIGTTSKALASEGGFVCTDPAICDLLRNQGRPYIYSTSASAPTVAAALAAVRLIRADPGIIHQLHTNIQRLTTGLRHMGLDILTTRENTPIIPIPVGSEHRALALSDVLRQRNIHIPAIRYPTVPRGQAILRVTVMATHSPADIDALLDALTESLKKIPEDISKETQ